MKETDTNVEQEREAIMFLTITIKCAIEKREITIMSMSSQMIDI